MEYAVACRTFRAAVECLTIGRSLKFRVVNAMRILDRLLAPESYLPPGLQEDFIELIEGMIVVEPKDESDVYADTVNSMERWELELVAHDIVRLYGQIACALGGAPIEVYRGPVESETA